MCQARMSDLAPSHDFYSFVALLNAAYGGAPSGRMPALELTP